MSWGNIELINIQNSFFDGNWFPSGWTTQSQWIAMKNLEPDIPLHSSDDNIYEVIYNSGTGLTVSGYKYQYGPSYQYPFRIRVNYNSTILHNMSGTFSIDGGPNQKCLILIMMVDIANELGSIAFGLGTGTGNEAIYVYSASTASKTTYDILLGAKVKHTVLTNGGGASHIALRDGQLKNLIGYSNDILIIAGAGSGGQIVNDHSLNGADAGGISGNGTNSGNQESGYGFGQGEIGFNSSGAGAGLYGGYSGTDEANSGAGSGYIANPALENKKMVGFNVPTSQNENTKTESTGLTSETPMPNVPKKGNGFVRIKFLRYILDE